MGWFSKKEENTGNLPELPELPEPNVSAPYNGSYQNLPAPPYPKQEEIEPMDNSYQLPKIQPKERVTKEYTPEMENVMVNEPKPGMQKSRFDQMNQSDSFNNPVPKPNIPMPPVQKQNYSQNDSYIQKFKPPQIQDIGEFQNQNQSTNRFEGSIKPVVKNMVPRDKEQPVFIRLDKFQATIDAFRDIRSKIREIEDLLAKTREIKAREEKELDDWEREIEAMKIKIEAIDREMFEDNQK